MYGAAAAKPIEFVLGKSVVVRRAVRSYASLFQTDPRSLFVHSRKQGGKSDPQQLLSALPVCIVFSMRCIDCRNKHSYLWQSQEGLLKKKACFVL